MTLTQADFDQIEEIVGEKIEEQTKNLPTKDEYFEGVDKIMGELQTIRGEHTILSGKVYDNHEDRITKIETHLGFQTN